MKDEDDKKATPFLDDNRGSVFIVIKQEDKHGELYWLDGVESLHLKQNGGSHIKMSKRIHRITITDTEIIAKAA